MTGPDDPDAPGVPGVHGAHGDRDDVPGPDARSGPDGGVDRVDPDGGVDRVDPDDLAGFTSPMTRLLSSARTWLAVLVAIALVVPAGAFLVDELAFRRSADAVVATLEGERAGADAAGTVLLVRAVGCAGRSSSGTAFVVDTDRGPALLTNRHVVEDARTVGLRTLDGATDLRVTGVRTSPSEDVAVLEVDDTGALPPPLALDTGTRAAGDEVRLIGFPAATPFTAAGEVAASDGGRLLLDVEVSPGASGSPVVADDGHVIGQVFAVSGDGQGVATPAARLLTAIADAEPAPGC